MSLKRINVPDLHQTAWKTMYTSFITELHQVHLIHLDIFLFRTHRNTNHSFRLLTILTNLMETTILVLQCNKSLNTTTCMTLSLDLLKKIRTDPSPSSAVSVKRTTISMEPLIFKLEIEFKKLHKHSIIIRPNVSRKAWHGTFVPLTITTVRLTYSS